MDDTLVLAKPDDFELIQQEMNSFDKNIQFTIDRFADNKVHFLDISINNTETDLFYKETHTGQYCHYSSQTPWRLKTAWAKALFHRAEKICSSSSAFKKQITKIRSFMSWNGYPSFVIKSLINKLRSKPIPVANNNSENDDATKIYIRVPFVGEKGEQFVKSCVRKLRRYTKRNIFYVTLYNTNKFSMFCPTKDKIPVHQRSNVIYELTCPGCGNKYIGKTDRCIITRLLEHGSRNDQPMHQHLSSCEPFHDYVSIFTIDASFPVDTKEHIKNAVLDNYRIVDINRNWSQLLYLEAYYVKKLSPMINKGLKASRELQLFS